MQKTLGATLAVKTMKP